MRPIKFKGQGMDGCWYYGDLVHFNGEVCIKVDPALDDYEPVHPETVSQLWGYDVSGHEVYEGDLVQGLIDDWGFTAISKAVMSSTIKSEIKFIYDTSYPEVSWIKQQS